MLVQLHDVVNLKQAKKNPTDESLWQIYQSITNPRTREHAIYVKSSEIYAIQITSSVRVHVSCTDEQCFSRLMKHLW